MRTTMSRLVLAAWRCVLRLLVRRRATVAGIPVAVTMMNARTAGQCPCCGRVTGAAHDGTVGVCVSCGAWLTWVAPTGWRHATREESAGIRAKVGDLVLWEAAQERYRLHARRPNRLALAQYAGSN